MKKLVTIVSIFAIVLPLLALATTPNTPTCPLGEHFERTLFGSHYKANCIWNNPGCSEVTEECEQICTWVGNCISDECPVDEPEPEPELMSSGGASYLQFLPKYAQTPIHQNRVISWLFSKFSYGSVICSKESHQFALNEYGQPFDGTKDNLLGQILRATYNYGYEYLIEGDGLNTYHQVEIPESMIGTFYCRTMSVTETGAEVLSPEFIVEN